jgi:hypothetical protein
MAIIWTLRNATTTNAVGHSYTTPGGVETWTATRYYNSFDTSTVTPTLSQITAVKLYIYVTSITVGETYTASSDDGVYNWGGTLTADETDWYSTQTNDEGDTSITSTGWKSFTINKNNLDLADTTWVCIKSLTEGANNTKVITFASQNNATPANRPYLEITYSTGVVLKLLPLLGIGK